MDEVEEEKMDEVEEEDDVEEEDGCPHFCKMDTYQISYRCLILALLRTSMRCSS